MISTWALSLITNTKHRAFTSGGAPQGNSLLSASQPVTVTRVAVHRTRGGGALVATPQAEFHLFFFTFFTTFANVLTLQVFHHHAQMC
jgi:hypothetical protein